MASRESEVEKQHAPPFLLKTFSQAKYVEMRLTPALRTTMPNIIRCHHHAKYDTHPSSIPMYATLQRKAGVEDRGGCVAVVAYAVYIFSRQKLAQQASLHSSKQLHSRVLPENTTSMTCVLQSFIFPQRAMTRVLVSILPQKKTKPFECSPCQSFQPQPYLYP